MKLAILIVTAISLGPSCTAPADNYDTLTADSLASVRFETFTRLLRPVQEWIAWISGSYPSLVGHVPERDCAITMINNRPAAIVSARLLACYHDRGTEQIGCKAT
jgi:hypothetical protein